MKDAGDMRAARKARGARNYSAGLWAEVWAALYLRLKGYKILTRRYKCPAGEIDLIARHKGVLVFIEVKKRHTQDLAAYALTPRTRRRVEAAARHYLSRCNNRARGMDKVADHMPMRFDVVLLASPWRITHLDNAWETGA